MADTFTTEAPPKKAGVNPVYATAKTGITYSVYPKYEQLERVCGNCKHLPETSHFCNNPKTGDYLLDGLHQPILKPNEWYCPLWEAKESEGE